MGDRDVLDVLLETADGAIAVDREGRILLWNRAAEQITGRPAHEVLGRACCEVMGGRHPSGNLLCFPGCQIQAMASRGELPASYDMVILHREGRQLWLNVSTILVHGEEGRLRAAVHLFRDVTARREVEIFLQRALGEQLQHQEDAPKAFDELTPREREILKLIASGLPAHIIAHRLSISRATVRNHTQNILNKLGVHSKLAAVALAHTRGLIREG